MLHRAIRQTALLSTLFMMCASQSVLASSWFCQSKPKYVHNDNVNKPHQVEVRLVGDIAVTRDKWTLRNYQVYSALADENQIFGGEDPWRAEAVDFGSASKLVDDPNYRPGVYANHARFLLETDRGRLNLIFPKLENLDDRRQVAAVLDMKYDHFGTYVPLVCHKRPEFSKDQ